MSAHAFVPIARADAALALEPLLGAPLAAWSVLSLRRVLPAERVALVSDHPELVDLARRMGVRALHPDSELDAAQALLADVRRPFCSHETARAALFASVRELAAQQHAPIESIRIEGAADLELARALARGLPPDHPVLAGVRALRLTLSSRTRAGANDPIRAVVSDVDGVLTDGSLTLSNAAGAEGDSRSFHMQDGIGVRLLADAGIKVGWLSAAQDTGVVRRRAARLAVHDVDVAEGDKGPRFTAMCRRLAVSERETLYLGDDVNDLPAIALAGRSACPADARPEVRARVDLVLEAPGGRAAFREAADLVLDALRHTQ